MPITFGDTVTKTVPGVPSAEMWKELANFSDNMDTVFGVPSSTISYGGGSNVFGAYRTTTVHGPLLMGKAQHDGSRAKDV